MNGSGGRGTGGASGTGSASEGAASLDDAQAARTAGRDLLSLLLMDSRNHLLRLLAADESPAALRLAVQAGWHAEHWVACHVQRSRGEAADPQGPRLASIEPHIDAWCRGAETPTAEHLRAYLAQTLETTLDLLAHAEDSDTGLHVWRLALAFEDRCGEALALQLLQADAAPDAPTEARQGASEAETSAARPALHSLPFASAPLARPERAPLWLPAQHWALGSALGSAPGSTSGSASGSVSGSASGSANGSANGGYVPGNERWAHEVALPDFEIDAQPVNWAQFAEFAQDGGYDRRECWSDAGWAWQQAGGRRAPNGVAQWRGGVLLQRGGRLWRAPGAQPATGLSRHEAEAWCRWAGRRLPTEPEWELAACTAASRGHVWGEVLEWVAGRARAWPGGVVVPGETDPLPAEALTPDSSSSLGVLRGAPWMCRRRCRHPRARRFMAPGHDTMASGFRSCAA